MYDAQKQAIRKSIKQTYRALTLEQRIEWDNYLAQYIYNNEKLQQASTVLLFYSLPDEPDTHRLCEILSESKTVLLPVVEADHLVIRQFTGEESLRSGAYSIKEPTGPIFEQIENIDFALIPGVAFTAEGYRLGRGGGFYDRLLASAQWKAYTLGCCYPFQVLPDLPLKPHDKPVCEIINW